MSQNDLVIANQSFPATRADINSALQALGSSNSGTTEPATIYANMFWYDTTTKILKLRSEANDAWISVGYFDQSANAFRILDDTQVTNTSGTQTGLLGDQATATWEAGTGTTQSLVSPANVKAAIVQNSPTPAMYAYDVQEFTSSGTWTKPASAASGDVVIVWGVGGGGGGAKDTNQQSDAGGGNGGIGFLWRINNIASLASTRSVVIGAGGAGKVGASGNGSNGGNTSFGTSGQYGYCRFTGGNGGLNNEGVNGRQTIIFYSDTANANRTCWWGNEGIGGSGILEPFPSEYGGGGGGTSSFSSGFGAASAWGGHGGEGGTNANGQVGGFRGGGGGATQNNTGGAGGDGYMQVTSYRIS